MLKFMTELSHIAGKLALEHFGMGMNRADIKGRSDYVSFVDKRIEDELTARIRTNYPEHQIIAEERRPEEPIDKEKPCWIIDPLDGTTNYLRGIPAFAISIAFCESGLDPKYAVIYDPSMDETFTAEKTAGVWLNNERVETTGCTNIEDAIIACSLPFREQKPLAEISKIITNFQSMSDDMRRTGSAALDLAYVATGRFDVYWELGIWPWDTAAGELMVRCGGGKVSDFKNNTGDILSRRSVLAASSKALHDYMIKDISTLSHWLDNKAYAINL